MQIHVFDSKEEMGARAAAGGAERLRTALTDRGEANIIVATGASHEDVALFLNSAAASRLTATR